MLICSMSRALRGARYFTATYSASLDDLDEVERRVREAGLVIEYGPTNEPWGVRRFYVRDPLGRLINILRHG